MSIDLFNKTWNILQPVQRREAVLIFVLMFIGMLFEAFSIGLIIPVLSLIIEKDLVVSYPFIQPVLEVFGNPSHVQLIVGSLVVLVGFYVVKNSYLAYLVWKRANFVFGLQATLSQQLYYGYLQQPYTFHLQYNSSQLIRNILNEVQQFTHSVLMPFMSLISELLIIVGIMGVLVFFEPIGSMVIIAVFVVIGLIYYSITRNHILRWGKLRQYHDSYRIQYIQEGLAGIKDVKIVGCENEFVNLYNSHNLESSRIAQRQTIVDALPRLLLEVVAVLGVAVLVITVLKKGDGVNLLVPTLGVFAAAAFKLMPSVNSILISIQSLRFSLPVIDVIFNELKKFKQVTKVQLPKNEVLLKRAWKKIYLDNVSFKYSNTSKVVLDNIDLSIGRGEFIGFIGESGAGKSTLIDIILGLLSPIYGQVRLDDKDISICLRCWQDQVGYVPQSIFLTDDTLRSNIAFGLAEDQIDDNAVLAAIKSAQLDNYIKELPNGLDTIVGERGVCLSGGQRQRVGIARSLYYNPEVLVLDEATSSLDVATEEGIMQAINELHGKKTVLIITHRISTVTNCDRIYRMELGKIAQQGSYSDVVDD